MSITNAHKIVPILILLGGLCFPAFASTVYTYSGTFDYRIPADPSSTKGPMLDALIDVPDHLTIFDLDIGINLTHSSVFDLQIFLVSPSGTTVCLNMYDLEDYFNGEDNIKTIFDDEAGTPISQAGSDLSGCFQPADPLSAFDGEDAYGLWRLQIYDAYYADVGNLDSFSLTITVLEPATAILLIIGVGFVMIFRPRRA